MKLTPGKEKFSKVMRTAKPVIGMVHVRALPGTPAYGGSLQEVIDVALRDAATLKQAGFDALMLENMHDLPYLKRDVGHEISTAMTVVAYLVKKAFQLPCGIQILAGANQAALAAALASSLDFIRAEGFVFGHVADEGWIDADAGPLLRYSKHIGAQDIMILTDIKKKHSAHALTSDVNLAETARAAEFFQSDGVVVTGAATGLFPEPAAVEEVANAVEIPTLVGSGISAENLSHFWPISDGFIVGSQLKREGHWQNEVNYEAAARLMAAAVKLR